MQEYAKYRREREKSPLLWSRDSLENAAREEGMSLEEVVEVLQIDLAEIPPKKA